MPGTVGLIQTIKADVAQVLQSARERHRRGESTYHVITGLTDGIDAVLRQVYLQVMDGAGDRIALVAVGGYGRRELCPYSDIDLLVLQDRNGPTDKIERLVRILWDGGLELGHAVRTPAECSKFMNEDHVTAASVLENRFLAGGNELYKRFRTTTVDSYRKRRGQDFARTKLEQLRTSVYGAGRTIYVLEPHLKEGSCGLRDIQRVLWVENIRRGLPTIEAVARSGGFMPEQLWSLREAYNFYLRVRCELHFTNRVKQDILERDLLPEIAGNLGYAGSAREAVEGLMADYYRNARGVYRFLRHYIETGTQGRHFFARLSRKLFRNKLKPYLLVSRGILFLHDEVPEEEIVKEILEIFLLAQREGLRLSESLCEWMRRRVEDPTLDFTAPPVHERFVEFLSSERNAGHLLKSMHEAGVLTRVVPEFQQLDGVVNFDGHHQFTVDEHVLRALEELDCVDAGAEGVEEGFHRVVHEIQDRLSLRLALLLHDVGKGMEGGDHALAGARVAVQVCERLGLDGETVRKVKFLVHRHLSMFQVSQRRDFTENGVIESFASLVGNVERLKMLYLLTYIDVTAVGPGTWTAWKGVQLAEVYERAMICLRTGESSSETAEATEQAWADADLDPGDREAVAEHCQKIDSPNYAREIPPARMVRHLKLVTDLLDSGRAQMGFESFGDYYELSFCCRDRPHLFADLTGVLFSEGFNVLGAWIFSRSDGIAIDVFCVEVADDVSLDLETRTRRIREKMRRIESNRQTVDDLIREWVRSHGFRKLQPTGASLYPPRVTFDNESSDRCTVIDVVARGRPGLLYDLASALVRLGLDLRTAKVSTLTDQSHDIYYVIEADGGKVSNPARMREIEQALVSEAQQLTSALSAGGLKKE